MAELFARNTISKSRTISKEYKDTLMGMHGGKAEWGTTGYRYSGHVVAHLLDTRPYLQNALDYGCGKGTMGQHFTNIPWTEYDPGIQGKDTKPSGRFDLVTCTDVMEHVERSKVEEVIDDLAEYTGKVLFVDIACYETGTKFDVGPYDGQDVHITVRPPEWWIAKFDESGLLKHQTALVSKRVKGGYRERAQLIYERV